MRNRLLLLSAMCLVLALAGCSSDNTTKSGGAVDKHNEIEQQTKAAGGKAEDRE